MSAGTMHLNKYHVYFVNPDTLRPDNAWIEAPSYASAWEALKEKHPLCEIKEVILGPGYRLPPQHLQERGLGTLFRFIDESEAYSYVN